MRQLGSGAAWIVAANYSPGNASLDDGTEDAPVTFSSSFVTAQQRFRRRPRKILHLARRALADRQPARTFLGCTTRDLDAVYLCRSAPIGGIPAVSAQHDRNKSAGRLEDIAS